MLAPMRSFRSIHHIELRQRAQSRLAQSRFWKHLLLIVLIVCTLSHNAHAQSSDGPVVLPPPGATLYPLVSFEEELSADTSNAEVLELGEVVSTSPPTWYEPAYWFGPVPWDMGVELGLNGSAGLNESLSLRAGGHLRRKTKIWKVDSSLAYNKNTANSVETQNNALLDLRLDRQLGESPWSLFFLHQTLYDEFQAFDVRVSLNSGLGYQWIDTETLGLLTRFGAGTSREFGGPDNEWKAEALFGAEYEHKLTEMQRLSAKVDYFPQWDSFNQYRVVSDVGWEIDLDRPKNLSLKFSVVDRYDSTPNGANANEINYSALLIWGL